MMGRCSPATSMLLTCACYPSCAKLSVLWPRVRSCRPENRQGRAVQADGRGGQIGRAGVLTAFWKLQTLYQRSGQLDRALALTQDLGQKWRGEILVEYRLKAEQGSLQVVLGKFEESRMLMREAVGELNAFVSRTSDKLVSSNSRGSFPRLFAFSPVFSRVSTLLPAPPLCTRFREIIRGSNVTGAVTTGPQTSLEKTLPSPLRESKPVNIPSSFFCSRG